MPEKIRADHRERAAYVYVRQSSLYQVRHHREGQLRQYALADRARQLGFAQVVVVDDDLGISGSGRQERHGFGRLLTAVCQGEVGAVFALEASRLARNNRDWHHLIDLCAMTDTVLVDDDGVYDPRLINDRLLLGLKGTMSEFELSLFRQRARAAFEQKVQRGCALWELPVGFIRTEQDRVEKAPDRQVQQAIDSVFRKFRELGSARQTLLYFRDEHLLLPEVVRGTAGEEIVWRLPSASRIQQLLRNPCYAGALVYGRTGSRPGRAGQRPGPSPRGKKPMEAWKVLLRDHHDGYITWEEYLHHQRVLEANLSRGEGRSPGAARNGAALLSGLLRCGRCGRRLAVAYSGNRGAVARYACQGGRVERGSAACQAVGSLRVDRAVAELVLEAIQPAGIEAVARAMERALQEDEEKQQALAMALEKARYEAQRAQRQFDAVDPENRLVAGELEARWNQALACVGGLEARVQAGRGQACPLSARQKERLRELAGDLRRVWHHPAAPVALKKRILRTVIEEIVVNGGDEPPHHVLQVHWKGGVHSELHVKRNGTGQHGRVADEKAVALIAELSKICNDQTIAQVLNRLGYRTGQGKTWRLHHIHNVRHGRGLPNYRRSGEWLTLEETARTLRVSNTVIKRLIREGTLPAQQVVRCAPWVIDRSGLALPAVQACIQAVHNGRKLPCTAPGQC
ncbi:MAG TPA: recombinase family protein, partial [Gemmatimonadales bacterium]|nr:recombinase family protein [Gemmatimonadales bacterium]